MMDNLIIKNNVYLLLEKHLPNILHFIDQKDINQFVDRAGKFIKLNDGKKKPRNFLSFILDLLQKEKKRDPNLKEVEYYNYLLGKMQEIIPNSNEFGNLIRSVIFNFSTNNFHNFIAEVGALLELSEKYKFIEYEVNLPNGKQADLLLYDSDGTELYVDIVTIHFDSMNYVNQEEFEKLINNKIIDKFQKTTKGIPKERRSNIYIFPVIQGLTPKILKSNIDYFDTFKEKMKNDQYNSFSPHFFGSIQGTFFTLFSIQKAKEFL